MKIIVLLCLYMCCAVFTAETISIDFNTFALSENNGDMEGPDENFDIGARWNHLALPQKNNGELKIAGLVDSGGKPTSVSLQINADKINSWWSGEKLMPQSKLYRDYVGFPKPADIVIFGLEPNMDYELAIFGFPLTWGNVELTLNGQSLKVLSGSNWKEKQLPTDILKVKTDAEGKLSGKVKGMFCGLHISNAPLVLMNREVKMLVAEEEKEKEATHPPSKNVVYKTVDGVELSLDVYNPDGLKHGDKRPAIVFFHGGSWSGGWKTQFAPQCDYLASRGIVAITVAYRVSSRQTGATPENCVMDAKSAIRWVRKNATELGIDPEKIAAGGGSAGGHLAAATAYLADYNEPGEDTTINCRPCALILFNPVIDNSPSGYHFGPKPIADNWRNWSPMHNIQKESAVPTIFFLGEEDHLIPVATGEKYKKITEEAGAACEYYTYPCEKHGFFNGGKSFDDTMYKLDKFLSKLGYISGEPAITPE